MVPGPLCSGSMDLRKSSGVINHCPSCCNEAYFMNIFSSLSMAVVFGLYCVKGGLLVLYLGWGERECTHENREGMCYSANSGKFGHSRVRIDSRHER